MFRKPVVWASLILAIVVMAFPFVASAQGIPMVNVSGGKSGTQYSLTLQLLALMTSLTLLPSFLLMMTSFVRIIIVLSILRQALGTGQTPPQHGVGGLGFVPHFVHHVARFGRHLQQRLGALHAKRHVL